jgi:hypothetical protein
MKSKIVFKIMLLVVVIFFHVRFLSHFFSYLADNQKQVNKRKTLKVSHLFFPLDYFASYKVAFMYLYQGFASKDNSTILSSIKWFKKSIKQNPFYHLSHHNLGKAYLFFNYPRREFFNEGIKELKKAVEIYRNNKIMVRDTVEVLLSMWPLLSAEDKKLCQNLLMDVISELSWEEYKKIVEVWWLYSKNLPFLEKIVSRRPDLLFNLSQLLIVFKCPLEWRWNFMADYETHVLKNVVKQYRNRYSQKENLFNFEYEMLQKLKQYRGYHRLAKNKNFDLSRYQNQKNILIKKCILWLLNQLQKKHTSSITEEINNLIIEYIQGNPDLKELADLEDFLNRRGFFKENDFKSLYLKYRLKFAQSNFSDLIGEIEKLKNSITFIKNDQMSDYINLLLLLSNAYESSKLLTIANKTLREILNHSSENPEVWLRLYMIQKILGPDSEIHDQVIERIDQVKQNSILQVDSLDFRKTVYFVDKKQVKVTLAENLKTALQDKNIIQIYINSEIVYEEYLSKLPDEIEIDIDERVDIKKAEVTVGFL